MANVAGVEPALTLRQRVVRTDTLHVHLRLFDPFG